MTKWIKRERPKIDRIACPWLIRRFIEADASSSMCQWSRCSPPPKKLVRYTLFTPESGNPWAR
jgi:hypothetical protein